LMRLEGATQPLAEWIVAEESATELRIYILDNSGSTAIDDGKVSVPATSSAAHSYSENTSSAAAQAPPPVMFEARGCTRWEEIKQLALQQAEYNVAVGTPAEFHLLNPKVLASPVEGQDFVVVQPGGIGVDALKQMLARARPGGGTPLAERLELIKQRLARRATTAWTGAVYLVIVTDGVPTPGASIWCLSVRRSVGMSVDLPVARSVPQ
jgi:hypothetical protein